MTICVLLALAAVVRAQSYEGPDSLRTTLAPVGPDPFGWVSAGTAPAPASRPGPVQRNRADLTVLKPYLVRTAPAEEAADIVLAPANPFTNPGGAPAALRVTAPQRAPDWNAVWNIALDGSGWDALCAAWETDPVAVRRRFREASGLDWPLDGPAGSRTEARRLAVARWMRSVWAEGVQSAAGSMRRSHGIRGRLVVSGRMDGLLSLTALGAAVEHPSPLIRPRVTEDPLVNRFGVGWLVRLSADLAGRNPLPTLDLGALSAGDAAWAVSWVNECVRNGVAGLSVVVPADAVARRVVEQALKPMEGTNVYLPPPSSLGIVVSLDTAILDSGAWVALFRTYAALRSAGLWPEFVSDERLAAGQAALPRFRMLVVPAATWLDRKAVAALMEWTRAGGRLVVTDPSAFSRSPGGGDFSCEALRQLGWKSRGVGLDPTIVPLTGSEVVERLAGGRPAATARPCGDGFVTASIVSMTSPPGRWNAFWLSAAARAGVETAPWRENVTSSNVRSITGGG